MTAYEAYENYLKQVDEHEGGKVLSFEEWLEK